MNALHLYLVRHGEPVATDLFYGHADVPLSERGRRQAEAAARALEPVSLSAIYCSDLSRALVGAELLAAHGEARPTPIAARALREMHLGVLEQVPFADGRARVPELAGRSYDDMLDFRMPGGGESVRDLADRVLPYVADLFARHARPPADTGRPPSIAVVAHNTVNRVILACAAGLGPAGYVRFEQALGAISRIDLRADWTADDPWRATRIGLANWSPERAG